MRGIGDTFPDFSLTAAVDLDPSKAFRKVELEELLGRWFVLFSWPMDFTFVCPTEIAAFGKAYARFQDLGAEVLGMSTDSHYVHLAWREQHPGLRDLPFPMLADTKRELSSALGILHRQDGVALRATYVVDPMGVIRSLSVHDLQVGRSVDEVLRVLAALQTGELTPCGWTPGEATLGAAG